MHASTDSNVASAQADAQDPTGSLVTRPLLVTPGGAWCLKLYPTAGEATITHAPSAVAVTGGAEFASGTAKSYRPSVSHATRAKGRVRRYCRANRLRFLWTLTYAHEPSKREQVTADLRTLFRRLRMLFGRLPLLAVIERGTKTDRLHVHFAAGRFLSIEGVRRCWPHGIVHVGDPRKLPARVPARRLAAYLAKYVAKDLDQDAEGDAKDRAQGEHRYLVTQGFSPTAVCFRYKRIGQAHERMRGLYGHPDVEVPFGDWDTGLIFGLWCSFPDHLLHPPPRPR